MKPFESDPNDIIGPLGGGKMFAIMLDHTGHGSFLIEIDPPPKKDRETTRKSK